MSDFLQNLGVGLQGAGEILSPAVAQRNAQQRNLLLESRLRLAAAQRELAGKAIISGVQSGSIDPQTGRQKLAQLGFGDIPVGPSLEAQGTKAFIDWMKPGSNPASSSSTPGMNPTPGLDIPPQALASPLAGKYIQLEQERRLINKPTEHFDSVSGQLIRTYPDGRVETIQATKPKGPSIRINPKDWTSDSLKKYQQTGNIGDLVSASGGEPAKGWQLGTSNGTVMRVNANEGIAQVQDPSGNWKKTAIPSDFIPLSPSTAGLSDPKMTDDAAQLIADYRMAPLSGWALSRPQGQALMARVKKLNPDYDATLYYRKYRAEGDIATGKTGTMTRSFNVFIQHTDVMRQAIEALGNNNVQQFNRLSQEIKQQTGNPAPTNFDSIKHIYADELVKAIVGTGGNVSDRQTAAEAVNRAQSPQQLLGVLDSYDHLMAGQVIGTKQQYESSTGRTDFDKFLLPKTKEVLSKYGYGKQTGKPDQSQPSGPQVGQKSTSKSGKPIHWDGKQWVYD